MQKDNDNTIQIKLGQLCESNKYAHQRIDKIEKVVVIWAL